MCLKTEENNKHIHDNKIKKFLARMHVCKHYNDLNRWKKIKWKKTNECKRKTIKFFKTN